MLIDLFALLEQARRPWLEAAKLKDDFHHLVAVLHPDKVGDSPRFAQINTAYTTLSDPAARLRHLLELEAPELLAGAAPVPLALAESFMRIATLRQAMEAFTKQQAGATTPLTLALLAADRFALIRDVEKEIASLSSEQARLLSAIQQEDAAWDSRDVAWAPRLLALQQELIYVDKWLAQLCEALFGLQTVV